MKLLVNNTAFLVEIYLTNYGYEILARPRTTRTTKATSAPPAAVLYIPVNTPASESRFAISRGAPSSPGGFSAASATRRALCFAFSASTIRCFVSFFFRSSCRVALLISWSIFSSACFLLNSERVFSSSVLRRISNSRIGSRMFIPDCLSCSAYSSAALMSLWSSSVVWLISLCSCCESTWPRCWVRINAWILRLAS